MSLKTPVVFLIFNRPDLTDRVFERIAEAQPRQLFVVADGPRPDREQDARLVEATRRILDRVDWPCDVRKNYAETNLGCKHRVASGLDWVFDQVEEAIVLEDDCVPEPTFFPFCEELLDRYRDDERIMVIAGANFQQGQSRTKYSYYFSKYAHCTGWASWRRSWQHFDVGMRNWPSFREEGGLQAMSDSVREEQYWLNTLEREYQGLIDSWALAWHFACWSQDGLTILPDENLITNIGFRHDATHVTNEYDPFANVPTGRIEEIEHPPCVVRNKAADVHTFHQRFRAKRNPLAKLSRSIAKRVRKARNKIFVQDHNNAAREQPAKAA